MILQRDCLYLLLDDDHALKLAIGALRYPDTAAIHVVCCINAYQLSYIAPDQGRGRNSLAVGRVIPFEAV